MSNLKVSFWIFLGLAAAAIAIILISHSQVTQQRSFKSISSFEACKAAGYPIMESYPRQCSLPNGKFFVEATALIECYKASDCPKGRACKNNQCQ